VISLALGIGANTLIFSIVNAVLLAPLPVKHSERMVNLFTSREGLPYGRSSYRDYRDVRDRADVFDGVLARSYWPVSVAHRNGKPEVVLGNLVSGNYFDVVGVSSVLGRTFSGTEGMIEGADPVAVVSHRYWRRSLAADPDAVGQIVLINARAFRVIGVAPQGFNDLMIGMPVDVWIPITMKAGVHPGDLRLEDRGSGWLDIVAWLKDGVGLARAQAAMNSLASHLAEEYPQENREKRFVLTSGQLSRFPIMEMAQGVQALMVILTVVVGLVLLLACSNVANLMMSRAVGREQEMAMRLALGASRGRLMRQLLTESVLLAVCGGAAGWFLAYGGLELLALFKPPALIVPVGLDIPLNARVFGYTIGLSMGVGLVVGLAPAWRSGSLRPYNALRSRRPDSGAGQRHPVQFQRTLVAFQIALSFVLLMGAGLCLKSLHALVRMDPGFSFHHGLTTTLNLAYGNYEKEQGRGFYAKLIERIRLLPGVKAASLACLAPLAYGKTEARIEVEGYQPQPGESFLMEHNIVSSEYFATMGIPILEGRPIEDRDRKGTEPVVVINETMAKRFWGSDSPLDRTFTANGNRLRIIGVAKDAKYFQLAEVSKPYFYLALDQAYIGFASLLVKTEGDPRELMAPVLRELVRDRFTSHNYTIATQSGALGTAFTD